MFGGCVFQECHPMQRSPIFYIGHHYKIHFFCVYKSIPVLNDQLFAHFLFTSVNLISFMIVTIVSVLPGKMPLNYVSSICM